MRRDRQYSSTCDLALTESITFLSYLPWDSWPDVCWHPGDRICGRRTATSRRRQECLKSGWRQAGGTGWTGVCPSPSPQALSEAPSRKSRTDHASHHSSPESLSSAADDCGASFLEWVICSLGPGLVWKSMTVRKYSLLWGPDVCSGSEGKGQDSHHLSDNTGSERSSCRGSYIPKATNHITHITISKQLY